MPFSYSWKSGNKEHTVKCDTIEELKALLDFTESRQQVVSVSEVKSKKSILEITREVSEKIAQEKAKTIFKVGDKVTCEQFPGETGTITKSDSVVMAQFVGDHVVGFRKEVAQEQFRLLRVCAHNNYDIGTRTCPDCGKTIEEINKERQ